MRFAFARLTRGASRGPAARDEARRRSPARRPLLRWSDRRAALFAGERVVPRGYGVPRRRARLRLARGTIVALLVGAALALLALAALRISILRTRYELAATLQRETELRSRERSAAVDVRVARDPQKLHELAARQGFARPERVVDLSREASDR